MYDLKGKGKFLLNNTSWQTDYYNLELKSNFVSILVYCILAMSTCCSINSYLYTVPVWPRASADVAFTKQVVKLRPINSAMSSGQPYSESISEGQYRVRASCL